MCRLTWKAGQVHAVKRKEKLKGIGYKVFFYINGLSSGLRAFLRGNDFQIYLKQIIFIYDFLFKLCWIFFNIYTVNLCLVTIKYKNPSWTNNTVPQKYVFDFKKIWITWFQKELAIPRSKIRHMNFKKEILVPIRTTKDCHSCWSLLLVSQVCSLNWHLEMDSFVG